MELYLLGGVVVLVVAVVVMHNTIVARMNRARRAWADVITYEKLKNDVLPQLEKLAEDFKQFESGFIEKVTRLRDSLNQLDSGVIDTQALQQAQESSKLVLTSIKATAEDYPDIASTEVVTELMDEISEKNENVAAAITIFNQAVEQFNNSIEMVPYNMVNGMISKKEKLDTFTHADTMDDYDYKPNFS